MPPKIPRSFECKGLAPLPALPSPHPTPPPQNILPPLHPRGSNILPPLPRGKRNTMLLRRPRGVAAAARPSLPRSPRRPAAAPRACRAMSMFDDDATMGKCEANYQPLTPIRFLERSAMTFPSHTACEYGPDYAVSYADLYDRTRQLASALSTLGVGYGGTVAAMLNNTPQMLEAHYVSAEAPAASSRGLTEPVAGHPDDGRCAERHQHTARCADDRPHTATWRGLHRHRGY